MHPRYYVVEALADVREPRSNLLADRVHLEPLAGAVGVDQEEFLARSDRGAALDDRPGAPVLVGGRSDCQGDVVGVTSAARAPGEANAVVAEEGGSQGKSEDRERYRQDCGLSPSRPPPSFVDQPPEARSASGGP